MTREERMQWCKDRALEYARQGDANNALASMTSDLNKHPETRNSVDIAANLGMSLMMTGHLNSVAAIVKFINDFA